MTDLVIINPGGADVIYQNLAGDLAGIEPPLWCRLIAGYCRDLGHSVRIVDAAAGQGAFMPADLICIAAYGHQPNASTQSMEHAGHIARSIKQTYPETPIIMTGHHVSALPVQTLRDEAIDYVAVGEGPVTVERLLSHLKEGIPPIDVPGLVQPYQITPSAPLLDLADLHGDAWDLLPMDRYRAHNWQCLDGSPKAPYASIYTTLGCPYSCSFCMINVGFGGPSYRRRDPREVVREVERLYVGYGVQTLKIADEMFVLNPKHYMAICEGLAKLPFAADLNIWAYARVDTVKPDTLALMRRAGIRWLCLGIESGSAHVRDGAEKSFGESDIRDVVRAIQSAGINVIGNFIFGLPDDTAESMAATLSLAQELNCEFANFYSAMPYPGSKLYDETLPEHRPKKWSGYSQHSADTTPLPTATLSSREVLAFRDEAFNRYFTDDRYLDMIDRKFGAQAVADIRKMTSYRLERAA